MRVQTGLARAFRTTGSLHITSPTCLAHPHQGRAGQTCYLLAIFRPVRINETQERTIISHTCMHRTRHDSAQLDTGIPSQTSYSFTMSLLLISAPPCRRVSSLALETNVSLRPPMQLCSEKRREADTAATVPFHGLSHPLRPSALHHPKGAAETCCVIMLNNNVHAIINPPSPQAPGCSILFLDICPWPICLDQTAQPPL